MNKTTPTRRITPDDIRAAQAATNAKLGSAAPTGDAPYQVIDRSAQGVRLRFPFSPGVVLSALVLVASLLLCAGTTALLINRAPEAIVSAQTYTPSHTPDPTATPTVRATPTDAPTLIPSPTNTRRATQTRTPGPTATPSLTPLPTNTPDLPATLAAERVAAMWQHTHAAFNATGTAIWATKTPTITPSPTASNTPTLTMTASLTPTITPTAAPLAVFVPVASEYNPALIDLNCLTLTGCALAGSLVYFFIRRGRQDEDEEVTEPGIERLEPKPVDLDEQRLRATIKPNRERDAREKFEPYRELFLAIVELDSFAALNIKKKLRVEKNAAAQATALMCRMGILKYRGATPQQGYVLALEKDKAVARLKRMTILIPFPDFDCPSFVPQDSGQDRTETADRIARTERTEFLVFGADGKPIL